MVSWVPLVYHILKERQISNRLLVSYTLGRMTPSFISCAQLPRLLSCLQKELSHLQSRLDAYVNGLAFFQHLSPSSYEEVSSLSHIDNCLRLLDACLLGQWDQHIPQEVGAEEVGRKEIDTDSIMRQARKDALGEQLIVLCITCEVLAREAPSGLQRDVGTQQIMSASTES